MNADVQEEETSDDDATVTANLFEKKEELNLTPGEEEPPIDVQSDDSYYTEPGYTTEITPPPSPKIESNKESVETLLPQLTQDLVDVRKELKELTDRTMRIQEQINQISKRICAHSNPILHQ